MTWPDPQGCCSHSDAGDGIHKCREVDSPVTTTPHTVCACLCGAETRTPSPKSITAQVKLEPNGNGSIIVDGVELNSDVTTVTVLAEAMRGTSITVTMPHAQLAARGEITVCERTRQALTALGWTSPEHLAGMSKAFSEAARVELQEALGGLGTLLREWPELLDHVRLMVTHNQELAKETSSMENEGDTVLTKVAEALGDNAPSEVKWSTVIERIGEMRDELHELKVSDE